MQQPAPLDQATNRKYPEEVVIAIAKDSQGKFNPITLGWVMYASGNPPMMAVGIGLGRHSLEAMRQSRQFVISYPSAAMADDALFFGTNSGRDMDKLAVRQTKTQPATRIDGVLLSDAVANFECELVSELPTGDHVILAGEVLASHVNEDSKLSRLYTLSEGFQLGGVRPA